MKIGELLREASASNAGLRLTLKRALDRSGPVKGVNRRRLALGLGLLTCKSDSPWPDSYCSKYYFDVPFSRMNDIASGRCARASRAPARKESP